MAPFYVLIERIIYVRARQYQHHYLAILLVILLLGNAFPAYSQACYTPISGTAAQVGGIANTTVCIGQACLGTADYNELQKITDSSLETYANLSALVNINLLTQGIAVKNTNGSYPAGYIAGFVLSGTGAVDLALLNNVTMQTYLNGSPTSEPPKTVSASILSGSVLGNTEKIYATFTTTQAFDEIRLITTNISVAALQTLRIYAAVAFPANCSSPQSTTVCSDFINGQGTDVTYNHSVTCLNCALTNRANLIDGDKSNYAVLTPTSANAASAVQVGVIDTKRVYSSTGRRVGFVISKDAANALLAANLFNTITIETYLFGTQQETRTLTSGSNALNLTLLSGTSDVAKLKLGFATATGKDFNEVRIRINTVVGANIGSIRIYGAFVESTSCTNCEKVLNDGNASTTPYSISIVSGSTGLYGAAVLPSLSGVGSLTTASSSDFVTYNTGISVVGGVRLTVKNNGTDFPGQTFVGFHISTETGLIDVGLLEGITVRVYKDGNPTAVATSTAANLLGASLIGGTDRSVVGFVPNVAFDQIQLDVSAVANLLGEYRIYDVFVIEDTDNDGTPDCQDECSSGSDVLDYDGDGIPDGCDPDDDNDGIYDTEENPGNSLRDTDGDGLPDYHDLDSDNDGILDTVEKGSDTTGTNPVDTDGDGRKDYIDLDSDNDGINDVIETNGTDTDNNGKADGSIDPVTGIPGSADVTATPPNTDGTDNPDYRDLDSDNDGIPDLYESGITNPGAADGATKDGKVEGTDTDNDGILLPVDGADGTFGDANNPTLPNNDGDSVPDYRDLDSDNDGITDAVERGPDGTNPTNTDGDSLPDYRDLDSDNDGINDVVEATGNPTNDTNGDGIADGTPGPTGIPSSAGSGVTPNDADGDGTPNFQDLDSDNDGVKDLYESGIPNPGSLDTNNDGVVDAADGADNDGIPQTVDGAPTTYGDANTPTLPDGDTDNTPDYVDPGVDLTPTNLMPNAGFTAIGQSRSLTITVKNIPAGSVSSGTITVTVTKPTQYMTVAFSGNAGDEWTLTDMGSFFRLVSKSGVTIQGLAANAKNIGLTLTLTSGASSGASLVNTRIQSGSGGEENNENNTAVTAVNITL